MTAPTTHFDEFSNELMVHDPLSSTNYAKISIMGTKISLFCMDVEFKYQMH
jgi:hypothetical protein